jgi:2,4-dienoyl-CoA reductase-like NADH-dependent reductase (Old Yellow Enzyme family)
MWIHRENVSDFKKLIGEYRRISGETFGAEFKPRLVAQLTHSGRFSRPDGVPEPIIAYHHNELDPVHHIDPSLQPISDDELDALQEDYLEAARLCAEAGFDAVDIKCCHRYLNHELLSAFDRPGRYGGSFENRTRLLLESVDKVRFALGSQIKVVTRLNGFDALPRGFGTDPNDPLKFAPEEPVRLLKELKERGVDLVNITMGSPYYVPHVNRPFDTGPYVPAEHPLEGVARMMRGTEILQKAVPSVSLVGSGLTWLLQFSANLAAGEINNGSFAIAGFGRMGFAYPDFAADIIKHGALDPKKCCIACTKCSEIMKRCRQAGCVVRDAKVYAPIYKEIVGK